MWHLMRQLFQQQGWFETCILHCLLLNDLTGKSTKPKDDTVEFVIKPNVLMTYYNNLVRVISVYFCTMSLENVRLVKIVVVVVGGGGVAVWSQFEVLEIDLVAHLICKIHCNIYLLMFIWKNV